MIFRCGFSLQSDEQIYSRVIEDYFENLTYFKIGKLLYLPHCEKLTYHFKWRVIWNKVNSPLHEFEFKNWNVKVIFGSTVGGLHQRGGWVWPIWKHLEILSSFFEESEWNFAYGFLLRKLKINIWKKIFPPPLSYFSMFFKALSPKSLI